ncbi:MAG: Uma2 family endonuclease [Anaerolineae bacterium]|nr:Uma2 family endonuclease [Anaerolineae bacterium]
MAEAQITQQQHIPKGRGFLTLTEFLSLPDEQPFEVVSGEIVVMTPVQREHNTLSRRLFVSLYNFAEEHKLGDVWEEAAYVLDGDKRSDWVREVRQPDVSFIARKRVEAHNAEHGAKEGPWWLAPDLAIEIVSPTDRYVDVRQKIADYLRYGVQLIWVVEPAAEVVRVFSPQEKEDHTLAESAVLSGDPVLPGWSMPLAELFRHEG